MPDTLTEPVFINQTPDYQEAAKKVAELANYQAPLAAAAQELGLGTELQQTKDGLNNLKGQAQILEATQQNLAEENESIRRNEGANGRNVGVLTAASVGTGVVVGAIGKAVRSTRAAAAGVIAGVTTAALGGIELFGGSGRRRKLNEKAIVANQMDENHVSYQAVALQNNFIDQMATRMLEQQKALTGEGEDMKLISTAQQQALAAAPATPSMAEKYATAPAVSNAAAITEQKAEQAVAQAR